MITTVTVLFQKDGRHKERKNRIQLNILTLGKHFPGFFFVVVCFRLFLPRLLILVSAMIHPVVLYGHNCVPLRLIAPFGLLTPSSAGRYLESNTGNTLVFYLPWLRRQVQGISVECLIQRT